MGYSREVLKTAEKAVVGGKSLMGTFNEPLRDVNLLDAERPLGVAAPRFIKNLRLKEWEAFQISDDNWFICLAVSDIKLFGLAFILLYDKHERKTHLYRNQSVSGRFHVPSGLMDSSCRHESAHLNIEVDNRLEDGRIDISFRADGEGEKPDCEGRITAFHNTEPLVIVQPFGENRPLYSHKALMPGRGRVTVGERSTQFENGKTAVVVDDHKGYYPYRSKYDWVTALGYRGGVLTGFNLTENQIREPSRYNENCLWLDGKMIPLPPVIITRPGGLRNEWLIRDGYGRVELSFKPLSGEPVVMNLGLLSIFYYGPTGSFEGYILDDENRKIDFGGWLGMGEKRSDRM